jgi:hypothetical protein
MIAVRYCRACFGSTEIDGFLPFHAGDVPWQSGRLGGQFWGAERSRVTEELQLLAPVRRCDLTYWVILPAVVGGVLGDVLYRWIQPDSAHPERFRLFAGTLPVVLYAAYFAAMVVESGIWWPVHVWAGGIALAALCGVLASYLVVPPVMPMPQREV